MDRNSIITTATVAGQVAGLVMAYRGKKSGWTYVGYFFLGGLVVGGSAFVLTTILKIK